jgi:hypothetical protein
MERTSSPPAVDPRLTGVWKRESISTPDGAFDDTTEVYWLQTRSWYADVRAPQAALAQTAFDLQAADADALVVRATMEGFAGQLEADPSVCRWRRDFDFQPTGLPDEGEWTLDGDVLVERGIHAEYEEIWRLEPDSRGLLAAFELTAFPALPGRRGLLTIAGDHFLAVIDRASPLPPGASLATVVAEACRQGDLERARAALDMPVVYGRIAGGRRPWEVLIATCGWTRGAGFWPDEGARFEPGVGRLEASGADGSSWRLIDASVDPALVAERLNV